MGQDFQMTIWCSLLLPLLLNHILDVFGSPLPPLPPATAPLFDRHPFFVAWNIPTGVCQRYDIPLDTTPFAMVSTPDKLPGQVLNLFYKERLGLYPYVDEKTGKQENGGIPQKGLLQASLRKAHHDITYYIPSDSSGLAVVDWEEWRPLWERNWAPKLIYRYLSISHAHKLNPSISLIQTVNMAKQQFQKAGRRFMEDTLSLGVALRPNYLWGFYLFPDCYNYGWEEPGYTGHCPPKEIRLNEELLWLWEVSTALYPSVYLKASHAQIHGAALYVRNRVQEAMRVASLPRRPSALPIYVYSRPVFTDQNRRFLSEVDLVHTIGESAAVGASGVVMWGATADFNNSPSCEALSIYLTTTLGPYVTNVTVAARLCSTMLCQDKGRCVRRNYDSDVYLHLSAGSFRIYKTAGHYVVVGRPSYADLKFLADEFMCQCYVDQDCSSDHSLQVPSEDINIWL